MQSREYRDLTDSVAIRDPVTIRPREPFAGHGRLGYREDNESASLY